MYNGLTIDEILQRYSKALHAEAEAQRCLAFFTLDLERTTNEYKARELATADPKEAQWKLDLRVQVKLNGLTGIEWRTYRVLEAEHAQRVARVRVKVYEFLLRQIDPEQVRHERIMERMKELAEFAAEHGLLLEVDECDS